MKQFILLLIVCWLYKTTLYAQQRKSPNKWTIGLLNAHSAYPFESFSKLFYKDFHPGIEGGLDLIIKEKLSKKGTIKHQWIVDINGGYLYHQWVQHNFILYAQVGYRKYFLPSFSAEFKVGCGYQHSFADSKIYKLTEDGLKKKANFGRPQFTANFSISINKEILQPFKGSIFLEYQLRVQTPFINEYVPLLPYNILKAGLKFPIKPSPKSKK